MFTTNPVMFAKVPYALEDFAPILLRYRAEWFPNVVQHLECCDPAGSHDNSQGIRNNGV